MKKKIVVIGGTGLIGSKVVADLTAQGFEAVPAAPNTGVNTITGDGLAEVLEGAATVVDVSNSPSFEESAVMDFFTKSTGNLLKYEETAGVKHHVVLSIVGMETLPDSGYFRAKLAQEKLVKESGVAYSIVRSTQFMEFVKGIADAAADGDTVRIPPVRFQPIAADDAARAVAEVASGEPLNGTCEIAGPEVFRMDEFIQQGLSERGDTRKVVADPDARYFGAVLSESSLVPEGEAKLGETRFAEWQTKTPTGAEAKPASQAANQN